MASVVAWSVSSPAQVVDAHPTTPTLQRARLEPASAAPFPSPTAARMHPILLDPIASNAPLANAVPEIPLADGPTPAELMREAMVHMENRRLKEARDLLLEIADRHADSPEAPEALLQSARISLRLPEALADLQRIVDEHAEARQVDTALQRIGELSFILGRYDKAAEAYAAYRDRAATPEAARAAEIRLALALLRAGHYENARREFALLRERHPDLNDSPDVLEAEADSLLAVGDLARADSLLEQIENRFPNYGFTAKVLLGRGLCAELDGRIAEARKFYERVARAYPRSIEAELADRRRVDLARPILSPKPPPPAEV
jgi:tetratricopeptide (TPR) repeat protein